VRISEELKWPPFSAFGVLYSLVHSVYTYIYFAAGILTEFSQYSMKLLHGDLQLQLPLQE